MDSQIKNIYSDLEKQLETGVAELAVKIIEDAQLNSRVDEGNYRGSWRANKGSIDTSTGKNLEDANVLKSKLITKKPYETVYITNNVDYAVFLEAKDSTLSNAIFRAINTLK